MLTNEQCENLLLVSIGTFDGAQSNYVGLQLTVIFMID